MITWMQRHRKYLVVTLWISAIAFIGAGFVGWGAYDFNTDRATAIIKVGDEKVTLKELQSTYRNLYSYYNERMGGTLTNEKAQELGLEEEAIRLLTNNALLINYAKELGLDALDSEVQNELLKNRAFFKEGKFNKEQYYLALKNIGLKANDFERSLRKEIILNKLNALTTFPITELESEVLFAASHMEDTVSIETIKLDANITLGEEETKTYWEKNKNNYLTKKTYQLSTIEIPLESTTIEPQKIKQFFEEKKFDYKNSDGKLSSFEEAKEQATKDYLYKITKKSALKKYLELKKGEAQATQKSDVTDDNTAYDMEKIQAANVGDTIKPIKTTNGYIVAKLDAIKLPEPKTFADAREIVEGELKLQKASKMIEERAKELLKNGFTGNTTLTLSRDTREIDGINPFIVPQLLQKIFTSDKEGYIVFGDQAIVFTIVEQNLLAKEKYSKMKKEFVTDITKFKGDLVHSTLLKTLRDTYKVERYYKGN